MAYDGAKDAVRGALYATYDGDLPTRERAEAEFKWAFEQAWAEYEHHALFAIHEGMRSTLGYGREPTLEDARLIEQVAECVAEAERAVAA